MFKKNIFLLIALIIFSIAFVWNVLIDNETENIKKNTAYAKGVVIKTKARKGGSWQIIYEFYEGNNIIRDKDIISMCIKLSALVEGQTFTIIYNRQKPMQSRILITEKSFNRFGLALPDSLKWVKEACE